MCGHKPNFTQLSIILTASPFCKSKLQLFTDLLKERQGVYIVRRGEGTPPYKGLPQFAA